MISANNSTVEDQTAVKSQVDAFGSTALCKAIVEDNSNRLGEATDRIIFERGKSLSKEKGPDGFPILCHALIADNPKATAQLLLCGCDPDEPMPDGSGAVWEWAARMPNRNRAVDTLASFIGFKESLPVETLLMSIENMGRKEGEAMDAIKSMEPGGTVVLYHGTKGTLAELSESGSSMIALQRQGLEERCGPTLSVVPLGGFWHGLGFKVEVPRSLVSMPGELNPNAIIHLERGVGYILTADKKLNFEKVKATPLVSLSINEVYKCDDDFGTLMTRTEHHERRAASAVSPADRDKWNLMAGKDRRMAFQSMRFGCGDQYAVEVPSLAALEVLEKMALISASQRLGIDEVNVKNRLSDRRQAASLSSNVQKAEPASPKR